MLCTEKLSNGSPAIALKRMKGEPHESGQVNAWMCTAKWVANGCHAGMRHAALGSGALNEMS